MGSIERTDNFNTISVSKAFRNRFVYLTTKNPFFKDKELYIYNVEDNCIVFTRPTIDYNGKTIKPTATNKKNKSWVSFGIKADIPTGKYEIDEDSDEDTVYLYF